MSTGDIIAIIIVVTIAIIVILVVYNYFVSNNQLSFLEKQYQQCFYNAGLFFASGVNTNSSTALNEAKNYYKQLCIPIVKQIQQLNPFYDLTNAAAGGIYNLLTYLGIGLGAGSFAYLVIRALRSSFLYYAGKAPSTVSQKAISTVGTISNYLNATMAYDNLENGEYRFYGTVGEFMSILTGPLVAILKNALYITSGDVINQIASYVSNNMAYDVDEMMLMFDEVIGDAVSVMITNAELLVPVAVVALVSAVAVAGVDTALAYLADIIPFVGALF